MARLLSIAYGGVTIGLSGDASYYLTDRYTFVEGYTEARVELDVIVSNSTRATFLTAEAALTAAFRVRNGDLSVKLGSTNRHVYSASSNTGFLSKSTCEKSGTGDDTANSSRWTCTVVVQLPADESGKSGRRDGTIKVVNDDSERVGLELGGEYTALSSNSASAQFVAAIDTWAGTVKTGLGGTWNTTGKAYQYDDEDKVLRFSASYEKILLEEAPGTTDVSSIVNQQLRVARSAYSRPHAAGYDSTPLQNVSVEYSASIRSSVSTNLASIYVATVRPQMLRQLAIVNNGGTLVVTQERPTFDAANNRIFVRLEGQVDKGSSYFEIRVLTTDSLDNGKILLPVWNGNPYARREYQGPKTHYRSVRVIYLTAANSGVKAIRPSFDGFVELGRTQQTEPREIGVEGFKHRIWAVTQEFAFLRADDPGGSSGGGLQVNFGIKLAGEDSSIISSGGSGGGGPSAPGAFSGDS